MTYQVVQGDCLEIMAGMADCSVDAIVTDPPYGLSFMGKNWDHGVPGVAFWTEAIRVLKPGGHLLAFGGTRTYHRLAVAIEDAGFEIRDSLHWIYGCLSEDTEILINGKWEPYHKATVGSLALCYNVEYDTYEWQPIQRLYVYEYADTAYRIYSDHTDQLVSRNHRCLVEQGGRYVFRYAEALEPQARVPVLESVRTLLDGLPVPEQNTDTAQPLLFPALRGNGRTPQEADGTAHGGTCAVCGMRRNSRTVPGSRQTDGTDYMLQGVQREIAVGGVDQALSQWQGNKATGQRVARGKQSRVEGRGNVLQAQGQVCESGDQVCALPGGVFEYGAEGRVCDGTSPCSGTSDRTPLDAHGSGTPRQPRCDGQPPSKPDAICEQCGSQTVRASRFTRSDLATVTPVPYVGKVWCVQVSSGAFVARRNGKVFVTGNSGFPKSHDIGKAIDREAGAVREVVGQGASGTTRSVLNAASYPDSFGGAYDITAPATHDAARWDGWGSALKPAHEPIIVARKPISERTLAANVLRWGTGGINVDGCRVGTEPGELTPRNNRPGPNGWKNSSGGYIEPSPLGRFPPNLLLTHSADCDEATCADDCPVAELGRQSGVSVSPASVTRGKRQELLGGLGEQRNVPCHNDTGTAARFFPTFRYVAKASRRERNAGCEGLPMGEPPASARSTPAEGRQAALGEPRANHHPTVKPIALMQWLCRLVTPPGGVVLDPFCGSGSTGVAALTEGFQFIGIEREAEYVAIARARLAAVPERLL